MDAMTDNVYIMRKALHDRLAAAKLAECSGIAPDLWNRSCDVVCGIGDEYFYTLKTDPNQFVYMCLEDGQITSYENS